jgi:integrase
MGFTHQLDRHVERRPLKTKRSRRTLEVTPRLISTLRALKLVTPYSGSHDLVFTTRTGSGHDHRNIGGRVLRRAVTRAGLEPVERDGIVIQPGPTFHSLRHSHASRLIAAGWDIEEVSARLGHSNVATTQREYVHEFDAAREPTNAVTGSPPSTALRWSVRGSDRGQQGATDCNRQRGGSAVPTAKGGSR